MYDLSAFGLSDLVRLSAALRVPSGAESMESAARFVVRHLYENLLDKETGDRSSVLVRFYKTHAYDALPPALRAFADTSLTSPHDVATLRCLTLLATAGVEDAWNDRRSSRSHQAIPLPSADVVARSPMIHQLLADLGLPVEDVVAGPSRLLVDAQTRSFNVFHVAEAEGSPYVPAQDDFVVPYGVRSVVGFGGLLPDGNLYAVILFSRTRIARDVAELFPTVALGCGLAVLPFMDRVFDDDPPAPPPGAEAATWKATALDQLLHVREHVVLEQSLRIEQALTELEEHAAELARSRAVLAESEARNAAILQASLDAIVTVDADGRIVEFNPAAEHMFGHPRSEAVGALMKDLIVPPSMRAAHAAGFDRHLATGEARIIGQRVEVPALHASGREFPAELTLARIEVAGTPMFTAHVRDLTETKAREAQLRELADTLQAGLLPPRAPVVPGLDIATHYRAGGHGVLVGGDFYDVFPLRDGEWGVLIGDVCGKGARAASLTSLVRYTARAAAAHGGEPEDVLREMNAAILGDEADDRYCSAVYARLCLGDDGVDVTACSGGHPAPLLVHTDGHVEQVCDGGQLIGLFEDFAAECANVHLLPGDALVLYTDGVTEARAPDGAFYGDARLVEVLNRMAGRSASDIAEALVGDVLNWTDDPDDDVAVVVLRALDEEASGGAARGGDA